MSKALLERYERLEDGTVVIDVTASRVEELYNDFDKSAPYIRRDLDEELVEYLIGCARELENHPFCVRITLDTPPDEQRRARILQSITAYFFYLEEREQERIRQLLRRAAIIFSIGLGLLFLSIYLNQALGTAPSVVANVFAEGLTIAAWVSLWESLATLLIEWFPLRKNNRIYRRLGRASIHFRTRTTTNG